MFSMVVTLMSIALVAVLVVASIHYGGSAYYTAATDARATQLTNEAEQIISATSLFRTQHLAPPSDATLLVSQGYLKSLPPTPWQYHDGFLSLEIHSDGDLQMCALINERVLGDPAIPNCASLSAGTATQACCSE
nr:hypothetical protein [uncultured Halomonas sp.]